jgi:hypothetical protein
VITSPDRKEYEALADMRVTYERSGKEIREVANIQDVPWTLALAVAVVENAELTGRSQDGLSYGAMQTNAATLDGVIKFAFQREMSLSINSFISIIDVVPHLP